MFGSETATAKIETVVLISVDGLGAHLLSQLDAPHIQNLAKRGAAARRAETVIPAKTIPAHVSMLSGVDPKTHGSTYNDNDENLRAAMVPTIFDLLKSYGQRSAAILGKEKLKVALDRGAIDSIHYRRGKILGDLSSRLPSYVQSEAIRSIEQERPRFLFVHFALPDTMGHWFRWETRIQKWSVRWVDHAIGEIVKALEREHPRSSWAVIVTSDHGGHGGSHGEMRGDEMEDRARDFYIPWLILGARLKADVERVRLIDTAPSVAALLGLNVPPDWKWQGQSVVMIHDSANDSSKRQPPDSEH